jgi:ABC-type sugar transport system substrate-binding protein
MRPLLLAVAVALSAAVSPAVAQGPYKDPWEPAVERAAEAAVARLGAARALEIRPTVLTIPVLASTGS